MIRRFKRVRKDIINEDDENFARVMTLHLRELRVNEDKEIKTKNINRFNSMNPESGGRKGSPVHGVARFKSPGLNKDTIHGKSNSLNDVVSEVNILSSIKQIANKQNINSAKEKAGIISGQKLKIKPGSAAKGTIPSSGS